MARFRNYFLTGLIVAGPIAITLYLTWWFVTWVDGLVRPFVPVAYRPETYLPFPLPGTGLIIAVFALTLLGFLTANLVGRKLVDYRRAAARAACPSCARSIAASSRCSRRCSPATETAFAASASSNFPRPACGRSC